MLNFFRFWFFPAPYYLRVSRDRVLARNVSTGHFVEVTPKIGVDNKYTIVSVGDPVDPQATKVLRPFEHPRVLFNEFAAAEKILQFVIRELSPKKFFAPSNVVVVHPDSELEGGLTQIEARALREMVQGAGAREVHIYCGPALSDREVEDGTYEKWGEES